MHYRDVSSVVKRETRKFGSVGSRPARRLFFHFIYLFSHIRNSFNKLIESTLVN